MDLAVRQFPPVLFVDIKSEGNCTGKQTLLYSSVNESAVLLTELRPWPTLLIQPGQHSCPAALSAELLESPDANAQ